MHIGVVLPQVAADWPRVLDAARHAEVVGADSVWVVDHLLGLPADRGILEAWTLMSAVAASTTRVEVGAQVLCQSFRPPGLLARMAATLDQVSGGRLRVMVGAGWFEQEYLAYGFPFPPNGVRVEELRDTVRIVRGLLNAGEPFTYEGERYAVHEALNVPPPVRRPFPVEVGGAGNRVLRIVARDADGWNFPGLVLENVDERLRRLAEECERGGRRIGDLRLSCQIVCAVGDDDAAAHPALAMFGAPHGLVGSVTQAAERAGELMAKGIRDFNVVLPPGSRGRACLERLVGEVRPQVL